MSNVTSTRPLGPRDVFERMRRCWLTGDVLDGDLLADDVIVETPFSPPGRPRRIDGRAEFLAIARAGRAALPVRFEACRNVVVHETTDQEVIVVEYELSGTVTTTNRHAAAPFIGVLRVRDGRITHWREYQDTVAIAAALGRLPEIRAEAEES